MTFYNFCPICNSEITQDRHMTSGSAICKCGWTDSNVTDKAQRSLEIKKAKIMVGVAICAALFYGHCLSWGSYAIEIPFVKLQQMTGTLSKTGYETLAQQCVALNKYACAKQAYIESYHQHGDTNVVQELAHLQNRLGEKQESMQTYASYFKLGGKNAEAAVEYGNLLEGSNQYEAALSQYEEAMKMHPEVLPVNATSATIRLMIKIGRYEEAYKRLLEFHESDEHAKGYLNTELTQLETKLGPAGQKQAQEQGAKANGKLSNRRRGGVASR